VEIKKYSTQYKVRSSPNDELKGGRHLWKGGRGRTASRKKTTPKEKKKKGPVGKKNEKCPVSFNRRAMKASNSDRLTPTQVQEGDRDGLVAKQSNAS